MKTRSTRLNVESLDGRIVPSTVAYGDLNHDGRADMAAITNSTTITVSLANANGGYTVSDVLAGQNNRPLLNINIFDSNGDGNLDVVATSGTNNNLYFNTWLGLGDGTFGNRHTDRFNPHQFNGF
jgi:VCBS repeat protein